ncbi:translocation and assembly module lipoprotein TamL [Hymenobacter chitinivorans]|uniref:Outer membrane protein assembly factor BamA n=1 Tax=Hymenobacter chitinivorans DSM 11115 TaxID=1121954 RepID=A0A2M9BRE9_9BACT|nr:BamA/TamA family outer membrane protein [Hymenobacter chitinivorans]PJJ60517.1 outer membrane protein assembly factor BamA [Hymenobacter chitinivorans DSM 11115]
MALVGTLLVLAGCSPLRLLGPRQKLLSRIRLEGVKEADAERIEALYQQKPNSRFPLPKLTIYQLGNRFYNKPRLQTKLQRIRQEFDERMQAARPDSVKVGKLLVRREKRTRRLQLALDKGNAIMRLGEPPVVYDSSLTAKTVQQIGTFLKSEGFFRSQVSATDTVVDRRFSLVHLFEGPDTVHNRRVTVTYRVTENQPFHYTQLDYDIADSAVARVVMAGQSASLLHLNDRYNENVIGQERARLETLLKNAGYFDFRQQYISLEADTSFAPATVRLRTIIANPAPDEPHQVYTVRRVRFITDAGTVRFGVKRDTLVRDSVYYLAFKQRFSTKILDRKLAVRPGDRYSLQNTLLTQRQLSDLDMFRFNTVNYNKIRPTNGDSISTRGQLIATVNASPTKKYQETTEFGGTYVAGLPGPFINFRLKVRNILGGAEVLEIGLRSGFEGQLSRTEDKSVLTTQLGGNVNLIIPQFLVPWNTNRFLTRYNPKTRISASYTYVNRPEYTRTNLEATYDYIWQRSAFHQYVLTPLDLSVIYTPTISDRFQADLEKLRVTQGSPLFRSFTSLYIPSFNFTSLYNSNDFTQTRDARYLRLFAEVGGLTRSLYQDKIKLSVYDFAKISADYRRYHKLGPKSFFVYRLNTGVAHALTKTEGQYTIPYDKYFFAGGSSSVRAWRPRRLGTGTYTTYKLNNDGTNQIDETTGQPIRDYALEQPGEVLIEGNLEYRFPLYSFINGALFTDFGNVWTLQAEGTRQDAVFHLNQFYRQFAVGSGIGIRFDFTFLILRLDVATKVYDPTAPGNKFVLPNFRLAKSPNQTAFNLGIGYPF